MSGTILAIVGSARGDGHTSALLESLLSGRSATCLDLLDYEIRPYEYGRILAGDDFGKVAEAMASHQILVMATPVYWYAMSGRMKTLFDRFTDLVTVRRDLGRRLAGRTLAVMACGSDPTLPEGFEVPFRDTAAYLDMRYGGALYVQITESPDSMTRARTAVAEFGRHVFGGDRRSRA
jgi:hypothetical protein